MNTLTAIALSAMQTLDWLIGWFGSKYFLSNKEHTDCIIKILFVAELSE